MMEKTSDILGLKLKQFRKESRYTLKSASKEMGVSTAFLSMVENGKSGISFENLHKILKIYGKNLGDLTDCTPGEKEIINMNSSRGIASEPGFDIYGLARVSSQDKGYMAGFILDIEPGAANTYDSHEGLEYVFILKGEIRLTVREPSLIQTVEMRTGDTHIHCAEYQHTYANIGKEKAQVLVVESASFCVRT